MFTLILLSARSAMRNAIRLIPVFMVIVQISVCSAQSLTDVPTGSINPLSLSSAIQIGLANNPEIKSSSEKVNISKGRFWNAIAPAPMDFSITNDYVPVGHPLNSFGEKTVGISQTIELPTNYFFRGSKCSIEKKIAENEFASTKLAVIANIKKAYFKVLALQEQAKVAEANRAIAQDFVKKAEVRFSVGEGTNLEKLTAKVFSTEALNNVEIHKNHLVAGFAELNYALGYGKDGSRAYQLMDTLGFIPCDFTLGRLVDDALSVNPRLKAGKLRLDFYAVEKTLAWSSLVPEFNLACFSKQVRNDPQDYYGASFSIGIPLWFLLDQRGRINEASANVVMAESELRMARNSLYANSQSAFAEFKHEEKQVQLYVKEIIPQAEEIFRTAARSYEAGEITYIEYLQAQQTLINSRGSYIDALLTYNLAIVAMEEAVGKTLQ